MTDAVSSLALGRAWLRQAITPEVIARMLSTAALTVTILVTASILPAVLATFLGLDSFVVNGGSMSPAIREGALVISKRTDPLTVRSGDVITYRHLETPDTPVTHRVVDVLNDKEGLRFQTKGDANATPDAEMVSGALPVSRMVFAIPFAGSVLRFARSTPGHIVLVLSLVPLLLSMRGTSRRTVDAPAAVEVPRTRPVLLTPTVPVPQHATEVHLPQLSLRMPSLAWFSRGRQAVAPVAPAVPTGRAVPVAPRVTAPARVSPPAPVAAPRRVEAATWVAATPRMRQIAALLDAESQIQAEIGQAVTSGMDVVRSLIEQHEYTRALFEAQLDDRLRPAMEYADTLEANLDHLMAQLEAAGTANDPALTLQFERDRARAAEVRAQAERSKEPIRQWLDREAEAMDALLAVFDPDIAAIEARLDEQRRDLSRIAFGLRSDYLATALTFVQERADEVRGLAERGVTDASAVEAALRTDAERARDQSRMSPHLARVLAVLGKDADAGLEAAFAAPAMPPTPLVPVAASPIEGVPAPDPAVSTDVLDDDEPPAWVAA